VAMGEKLPMEAACLRGVMMNQRELIAAVAERTGLTRADAGKAVEALVGTITDALRQGDEIRIAGFGTFGISERGERQGRNPQTGAQITIAASKAAKFTAGKAVKDALNGG
jgi:DNA-binding protein HU-beta